MLFPMLRRPSLLSNGPRSLFADFERMQRNLDRLFESSVAVTPAGTPPIEFFKKETGFLVRANVPGFAAENLDIAILGRKLTIRGEYDEREEGDAEEKYTLRERRSGSFSRTLTLPQNIDADNVVASFKDGVVEIELPLAASEQPRRIEIGLGQEGEN